MVVIQDDDVPADGKSVLRVRIHVSPPTSPLCRKSLRSDREERAAAGHSARLARPENRDARPDRAIFGNSYPMRNRSVARARRPDYCDEFASRRCSRQSSGNSARRVSSSAESSGG
jgi:hypothetical protein